jgi:hypothetical protein
LSKKCRKKISFVGAFEEFTFEKSQKTIEIIQTKGDFVCLNTKNVLFFVETMTKNDYKRAKVRDVIKSYVLKKL